MKRIVIIISLILLVFCFASCNQKEKYSVYEVGGFDNVSEADHSNEIVLKSQKYIKSNAVKQKTVEVNGKEWDVKYSESIKGYLYNNDRDRYENESGDKSIIVEINNKTGRVDRFDFIDQKYLDEKGTAKKLTEEACLDIAKTYLNKYVKSSEYKMVESNYLEGSFCGELYSFKFVRVINGFNTSDSAHINVSSYGDVVSHYFTSLGEMKGAKAPTDDEMKIIEENVSKKLDSIYKNVLNKYDVSYETEDKVLIKTSDGRYALKYNIAVTLQPKNDEAVSFVEQTVLLIYLD